MGIFTSDIKSMDDLFTHLLQDVYYAENQLVKSMPEMIEKAHDPKLTEGLRSHLAETKNHVKRLEQAFQMCGRKAKAVDCPAMEPPAASSPSTSPTGTSPAPMCRSQPGSARPLRFDRKSGST